MSIQKTLLDAVGNTKGHFAKKENRAAKLLARWSELQTKFEGMIERGGSTRTAKLAYATLLMMETGIRIGNEGSAEGYVCDLAKKDKDDNILWQHELYGKTIQTYGLTTLLHQHVEVSKKKVEITFLGKKAAEQSLIVERPILIRFAPRKSDPERLWLNISYHNLKKFVKRYVGKGFSPKDLRTARVNQLFIERFVPKVVEYASATRKSEKKKILSNTIEETANIIGHTKGVCRSAYLSSPLLRLIAEAEFQIKKKGWEDGTGN